MIYKVYLPLLRRKIRRDVRLSRPNKGAIRIISLPDKITAEIGPRPGTGDGDWGWAICIDCNRALIPAPETDQGHGVQHEHFINTLPKPSLLSRLPKTRNYDTDGTRGLRSSPYTGIYSVVLAQGSVKDSPQPSNNQ